MIARSEVRVFLDANVLFSAAIGGSVRALWSLSGIALITSEYAAAEAMENLDKSPVDPDDARIVLRSLLAEMTVVAFEPGESVPVPVVLPDPDDAPILAAAIAAGCAYLLSGDKRCFGSLYGRTIEGVAIMRPGPFIAKVRDGTV